MKTEQQECGMSKDLHGTCQFAPVVFCSTEGDVNH